MINLTTRKLENMSGVHQITILVGGLCLDVELCPIIGNSDIVVIKLWF